jgi:hypothetical protein
MTISDATDSLAAVVPAALALPAASRAVLADLLLSSLKCGADQAAQLGESHELSVDEMAQRLTAHFHEAKKTALARAAAIEHTGVTHAEHD